MGKRARLARAGIGPKSIGAQERHAGRHRFGCLVRRHLAQKRACNPITKLFAISPGADARRL